MQSNQLNKAINLAKKTGDRLIVFDKAESVNPFVVMGLDEYEKLVIGHSEVRGLTENELLDKINRDIAIWKSEDENIDFNRRFGGKKDNFGFLGREDWLEDDYYGDEDENDEDSEKDDNYNNEFENIYENDFSSPGLKNMRENKGKRIWSIPSERKKAAEEVLDEDEDRQYLEEIPF